MRREGEGKGSIPRDFSGYVPWASSLAVFGELGEGAGLLAALREKTAVRLNGYIAHWDGDLSERIVAPALGDNAGIVGAIGLGQSALKGSLR